MRSVSPEYNEQPIEDSQLDFGVEPSGGEDVVSRELTSNFSHYLSLSHKAPKKHLTGRTR
jgi:hypothetical protein